MGGSCRTHGEMRNAYKYWSEKLKGRDYTEDLSIDGKII
jgi:hypothetical protein